MLNAFDELVLRRLGRGLVWFTLAAAVVATQWPFTYDLSPRALADKWAHIDLTWFHRTRDGHILFDRDFAQNLAMLAPLGVGYAMWRRASPGRIVAEALALGFATSLALEAAQLLNPRRFTQLDDLWRNTLGCVVGAAVAIAILTVRRSRAAPRAPATPSSRPRAPRGR